MRKTDLKSYIEKLVAEKDIPLQKQINDMSDEVLEQVKKHYLGQDHIKRIRDMADNLAEFASEHIKDSPINDYNIQHLRSKFVNLEYDIESKFQSNLYYVISGENDKNRFIYGTDYTTVLNDLANKIRPLKEQINQLKKLRAELLNIITVSRNGKDAYKSLVAAGVDMSKFEEPVSYLPAVVKLSVDPSILSEGGEKVE